MNSLEAPPPPPPGPQPPPPSIVIVVGILGTVCSPGGSPSKAEVKGPRARNLADDEYWRALVVCDLCGMRVQRGRIIQHQTAGKCNPQVAAMLASEQLDTAWHRVDFASFNVEDGVEHIPADSPASATRGASPLGAASPAGPGVTAQAGTAKAKAGQGSPTMPAPATAGAASSHPGGQSPIVTGAGAGAGAGADSTMSLVSPKAVPAVGSSGTPTPGQALGASESAPTSAPTASDVPATHPGMFGGGPPQAHIAPSFVTAGRSKLEALAASAHSGRLTSAAPGASGAAAAAAGPGSSSAAVTGQGTGSGGRPAGSRAQAGSGAAPSPDPAGQPEGASGPSGPAPVAALLASMHGTRDALTVMSSWGAVSSGSGGAGPAVSQGGSVLQALAFPQRMTGAGDGPGVVPGATVTAAASGGPGQPSLDLGGVGRPGDGAEVPSAGGQANGATGSSSSLSADGGGGTQPDGSPVFSASQSSGHAGAGPTGPLDPSLFVPPQVGSTRARLQVDVQA